MSSVASDSDLVLRMRQRQAGAFAEVYRRYGERIWRFLHRLTAHHATAEDLFQDTWLAAARNAHRLREDTQLLPWLYTIARNKHRNALRLAAFDRRRHKQIALEAPVAPALPDTTAEARVRAARVNAVFPQLATAHREILLLCLGEGLDAEAAAKVLDLNVDAVRKRLSRARAELARLVDPPKGSAL